MENNFQVYKFLSTGIPVSVHKGNELEKAVRAAISLAVHVPGHYSVCVGKNASDPILDLDYLGVGETEEEPCQKITVN